MGLRIPKCRLLRCSFSSTSLTSNRPSILPVPCQRQPADSPALFLDPAEQPPGLILARTLCRYARSSQSKRAWLAKPETSRRTLLPSRWCSAASCVRRVAMPARGGPVAGRNLRRSSRSPDVHGVIARCCRCLERPIPGSRSTSPTLPHVVLLLVLPLHPPLARLPIGPTTFSSRGEPRWRGQGDSPSLLVATCCVSASRWLTDETRMMLRAGWEILGITAATRNRSRCSFPCWSASRANGTPEAHRSPEQSARPSMRGCPLIPRSRSCLRPS